MDVAYVFKPTEEQTVRLKIHHGGMFIYNPLTAYVNGEIVEEEWGWDVNTMSYFDLTKVIKSIGYKAFKCLWYKHPKKALWKGLKPLNGDSDILQLAEDVAGFDVVEVYVEDGVIDRCDKKLDDVEGDEVVVIDGVEAEPIVEAEVQVEGEVLVEAEVQVEGEIEVEAEVEVEGQVDVEGQVQVDDEGLIRLRCRLKRRLVVWVTWRLLLTVWMIFMLGLTQLMMMWGLAKVMRIMLGMRKMMMIPATVVKIQLVILKKTLNGQHGWSLKHLLKVLRPILILINWTQ
ncbi:uncharacterized protein [Glycine max]|uniref:uncharacterized protein isoform X1 n=2 Tax=Glycine max TaxID=3847 RepID=UPI001B355E31|nr:uncharacterized protein LOC102663084 isoform X1 [Glycine max]XP_040863782.1 uncharacterized protein LOC102663084 isoform X1 [Glycine max]